MNPLERFEHAFIEAVENERAGLWAQGRAMVAARDAGVMYADVLKRACALSGRAKSTVLSYMKTARVFPEGSEALDLSFEHHRICAYQDDSQRWLQLVLEHDWNCEELLDAIKAAKGNIDLGAPRRVVDRQEAWVYASEDKVELVLVFDEPVDIDVHKPTKRYIVSIVEVLETRPESETS